MKYLCTLSFFAFLAISSCVATDLLIGDNSYSQMTWRQKAEYISVPFVKRVKQVFYSNPGQQLIKAILAKDLDQSAAVATVTAGGVGYSYVNIRLKGERGKGLNYIVEIYI